MTTYPSTEAVAETYNTPGVKSPIEAIEAYEEYQREWASSELGSQAISTRMELPRGRIRTWKEGGKPDVVRGIKTARENGWLECPVDGETFGALNRLVAGVFSGGSIFDPSFEPSFSTPDSVVETQLRADLEAIGAGCKKVMSNSGNVEELRPKKDATVLGRVLVALGAPQGQKAKQIDRLPLYLDDAPLSVRREFARVYVSNRAAERSGRDFVQIQEERSEQYLNSLERLLNSVVDAEVWRNKRAILLRESAVDELNNK